VDFLAKFCWFFTGDLTMTFNIHQKIQVLIEETNDAFSYYDHMNSDYAEFATLALSDFKNVLSKPSLTGSELKEMLRRSMTACRDQDPGSWSSLMAQHIARAMNQNK
jgi:hypothetical protein